MEAMTWGFVGTLVGAAASIATTVMGQIWDTHLSEQDVAEPDPKRWVSKVFVKLFYERGGLNESLES
ncbi:hypothetical protein ACEUCO_08760 [Aeromonas veronii]